jgi:hypothetical protein
MRQLHLTAGLVSLLWKARIDSRIRSKAADDKGRQRLARYMIRCPFALAKMRYDKKSGM